ncbi:Predicted ribonuclease, toxin component of the YeeF-YezG toxin-antitoxin module [Paenisporosarcina quisquiliarum]|nr:Predicted ribonuclease, toxin component of the YeeF-YezG toxin-antitoxin module [Paenisporosarcina quisquiliarum]
MKILDVDLFQDGLKRNIAMLDRLESEIEAIQRTVEGLVGMEDELKGEGGNAIRAFYAECHLPLLQYFLVSAAGYKQVLQQMENALYALEPDTSGHIVEQFLEGEVEQGLTTIAQLTENLTNESNSIMDQVSDIVALQHLNDSGVQESVLNAKRKRDDTVGRLQEFDATQTAALLPFEQDMDAMDTWIQNMEEMFNSNLTDIDFQQNHWAKLTSRNRFQSDLIIHTTSIAGISNKLSKESQLNLMFKTFMSSTNPIRFGYGGLIHRPSILFGPETLAFARLSSVQSDRQDKVNDTNIVDEELKVIYAELAKHPDFGNYRSDTLVDPLTGEYLHTFEGMRKVVGGNGSGTPDGLAPVGMFAFDFYTEDLVTMFGPDSTVNERLAAAVFTFGKPIKIADTGLDLLKSGEKAKNTGKGTVKGNIVNEVKEIDFGKHIIKGENGKKQLLPNTKYVTNDNYKYTTDEFGRIVNVDAPELVLKKADRNKYAQANIGGKDRLPDDDGGHLIGAQFNGPPDIDNLVPQNSQINRRGGVWYEMETEWANALKEIPPKKVSISIDPIYSNNSMRPDSFMVEYEIEGQFPVIREIANKSGG